MTKLLFTGRDINRKTKADERFLSFVASLQDQLVKEDAVTDYYVKNVRQTELMGWHKVKGTSNLIYSSLTPAEIRQAALDWFDRSLGRVIRRNYLKL